MDLTALYAFTVLCVVALFICHLLVDSIATKTILLLGAVGMVMFAARLATVVIVA